MNDMLKSFIKPFHRSSKNRSCQNRTSKTTARSKNSTQSLVYEVLESKELLASLGDGSFLVAGTSGDDFVSIQFTGQGNFVDIVRNGQPISNVDATGGLRIHLEGGQDHVQLSRFVPAGIEIDIQSTEVVETLGGFNQWKVNAIDGGFATFGTINDTICFHGATELRGGTERDVFTVYSFDFGQIHGGDGDDVFRFGRGEIDGVDAAAFGGAGNDYFAVRGELLPDIFGEAGNDVVTYHLSDLAEMTATLFDDAIFSGPTEEFSDGNELMLASQIDVERLRGIDGGLNRVVGSAGGTSQFDFFINGDHTSFVQPQLNRRILLSNFSEFNMGRTGADRYFVRSTTMPLELNGGDRVQISSNYNMNTGGHLDLINHQVSVGPTNLGPGFEPLPNSPLPDVFLNQKTGDATIFRFNQNPTHQVITGFTDDGSVNLAMPAPEIVDVMQGGTNFENVITDFVPEVRLTVFGSIGNDRFVVSDTGFVRGNTNSFFRMMGRGGDDVLLVGGNNTQPDSSMMTVGVPIQFFGGGGEDRVFVNDRDPHGTEDFGNTERVYQIGDNVIRAFSVDLDDDGVVGPQFFEAPSNLHVPIVQFDATTELIRINGAANLANRFQVNPNVAAKIVVDGVPQTDEPDVLEINDVDDAGGVTEDTGEDGIYGFGGEFKSIFFFGVDEVIDEISNDFGFDL